MLLLTVENVACNWLDQYVATDRYDAIQHCIMVAEDDGMSLSDNIEGWDNFKSDILEVLACEQKHAQYDHGDGRTFTIEINTI
jgi:hypothetical protein